MPPFGTPSRSVSAAVVAGSSGGIRIGLIITGLPTIFHRVGEDTTPLVSHDICAEPVMLAEVLSTLLDSMDCCSVR